MNSSYILRLLLKRKKIARLIVPLLPDSLLLNFVQRAHFEWFRQNHHPDTGLVLDRDRPGAPASIASTGFALTGFPVACQNGWISRQEAIDYALKTLRTLYSVPQGTDKEGQSGRYGFFYHFLDPATGARALAPKFWDSEVSSIDTALLMAGVLFTQVYFDSDNASEQEIRTLASALYERVEWDRFLNKNNLILHAWTPERGMWEHAYKGYSEALLLYILALGSPTHAIPAHCWQAFLAESKTNSFAEQTYIAMPGSPLFCYQYPHCWIDFAGINDEFNQRFGFDYAENSRRMTLAQIAYGKLNPHNLRAYSQLDWGWTACDGPGNAQNSPTSFRFYSERGAPDGFDDGTIAPTAALSSLCFTPEPVLSTIRHWLVNRPELFHWQKGFTDAFNPSYDPGTNSGWVDQEHIGIDQGPILLMMENHKSQMIWKKMRQNQYLILGLKNAGFKGGWLNQNF